MTQEVPLAPLSTLGVGGPAEWFTSAVSPSDITTAHAWSRERGVPLTVLGGGSNVVIADAGISGLVLHNRLDGAAFWKDADDTLVAAGAGESWDSLVAACVARGLAGVECLSGIPGCVGGTPIQNVGAYGQEVADTIETVTAFDRDAGVMQTLRASECRFAYRTSRFKTEEAGRWIVCGVTFRLRTGDPLVSYPDIRMHLEQRGVASPTVADVRDAVLAVRRRKGMVLDASDADTRSVGSFFVNPIVTEADRDRIASVSGQVVPGFARAAGAVKVPAAWLIEQAGFRKGDIDGAAGISSKHTLALVNRGDATAADIVRLAGRIKRTVADRFGVWLRPEPVFLGFAPTSELDYLLTDQH